MAIRRFPRPSRHVGLQRRRKAAAVVELAVCLPIMLALVLGALESCNMIYLQQALHIGAYEAARVAIQPESSTAAATLAAQTMLESQGVSGATVTCKPTDVGSAKRGTQIEVAITASCDANSISPKFFFAGHQFKVVCVMVKE
jgi:Flp pilus assembly protein TadG